MQEEEEYRFVFYVWQIHMLNNYAFRMYLARRLSLPSGELGWSLPATWHCRKADPLWTEWQTGVKNLPSCNFAGGYNRMTNRTLLMLFERRHHGKFYSDSWIVIKEMFDFHIFPQVLSQKEWHTRTFSKSLFLPFCDQWAILISQTQWNKHFGW